MPHNDNHEKTKHAHWSNPPQCWIALNTDGSVNTSNGKSSIGGFFRNDSGSWIFGFSRSIGIADPLQAEIWAIHDGLNIAWSLGIEFLQLYDLTIYDDPPESIIPLLSLEAAALIVSPMDFVIVGLFEEMAKLWFLALYLLMAAFALMIAMAATKEFDDLDRIEDEGKHLEEIEKPDDC
ncbi:hypothetical protein F3Y22_tig00110332pilonHSYRG00750 [Hibiscus syriacus]|uniref:RNase H type-1 domain-containing protein n=1 Tax=Hibiscus syriacus TaxID=106335 RepID=A0A6A3AZD8_HIBSY|nr:hypothetical protein F3Y22_tig00110332pilonHSYRG00750 [Hibiscus syriacus]